MMPLIQISARRALKSELNSCVKSFLLPTAFYLTFLPYTNQSFAFEFIEKLFGNEKDKVTMISQFFGKWIDVAGQITGIEGQFLMRGLVGLLRMTSINQEFASL